MDTKTPETIKNLLLQYGAHHMRGCDALNKWKELPCDCGFAALVDEECKECGQLGFHKMSCDNRTNYAR